MKDDKKPTCPHCNEELLPWLPAEESSWGYHEQYVCFNDECPYFVKGWEWMEQQYSQKASYRFRYNPKTGEKGPLPVWSKNALRTGIIQNEEKA